MNKYVKNPTTYVSMQLPVDVNDQRGIQGVSDFIKEKYPHFDTFMDGEAMDITMSGNSVRLNPGDHFVYGSDDTFEILTDEKFKTIFTQQL